MSRFNRILHDLPEGVAHSYARWVELDERSADLDLHDALATARRLHADGERYADLELRTLALMLEGRILVRHGRVDAGMAVLDEAMLTAGSGRMDPAYAGNVYCNLVAACHEVLDIGRMREWTVALARWCESLPPAVLFTGICRVHRAQLLQLGGDWDRAEREAAQVCAELSGIQVNSVAEAHYVIGEIRSCGEISPERRSSCGGRTRWAGIRSRNGAGPVGPAGHRGRRRDDRHGARRGGRQAAGPRPTAGGPGGDHRGRRRPGPGGPSGRGTRADRRRLLDGGPERLGRAVPRCRPAARGAAARSLPILHTAWRTWQELGAPYPAAEFGC